MDPNIDEIGKELELIFKNRETLDTKYYDYLLSRAVNDRYFKLGDIELSFRKAIIYWKQNEYPYDIVKKVILSFDLTKELWDNGIDYDIDYMEFDIKYNEKCKRLILSRTTKYSKINIKIISDDDK